MEFKLKDLPGLFNSLTQLMQIEMMQRTAYWLGRIKNKAESELNQLNENRGQIEKKYGSYKYKNGEEVLTVKMDSPGSASLVNDKGEKAEGLTVNPHEIYWKANSDGDFELYLKEMKELDEQIIKIDFQLVKISELVNGKGEPISVRPIIMSGLEAIFTE